MKQLSVNILIVFFVILSIIFCFKSLGQASSTDSWKHILERAEADMKNNSFDFKSGKVTVYDVAQGQYKEVEKIHKIPQEWKKILNDEEYHIAFEQGTERAFTGKYHDNHKKGVYRSKASGNDLFHSDHKFDSGTGWPSYYKPVDEKNILYKEDNSFFSHRVEIVDAVSGAHLGHVFNDGPPPTGRRYCINSAVLEFAEGIEYKEPKE